MATTLYETDILELDASTAQIILQQCNCVTSKGKGLSASIAERYPHADFYSDRSSPSKPGTIEVRGGKGDRYVCAMYAQYHPGAPSKKDGDTAAQRLAWFGMCLKKVSKIKNLKSVAFPYQIGCGLARGDWYLYVGLIDQFATDHPDIKTYIACMDPAPEVEDAEGDDETPESDEGVPRCPECGNHSVLTSCFEFSDNKSYILFVDSGEGESGVSHWTDTGKSAAEEIYDILPNGSSASMDEFPFVGLYVRIFEKIDPSFIEFIRSNIQTGGKSEDDANFFVVTAQELRDVAERRKEGVEPVSGEPVCHHTWDGGICIECGIHMPCELCDTNEWSTRCDVCDSGRICEDCYQMCETCDQKVCTVCLEDHQEMCRPSNVDATYTDTTLLDYTTANIPEGWGDFFTAQLDEEDGSLKELSAFISKEAAKTEIYPPLNLIYNAFRLIRPEDVKILIIGQDPYHGEGQAMGVAFAVPEGIPPPPSLRNIYTELRACKFTVSDTASGDLTPWCAQGVMLLNTALTVRAGEAGSHATKWADTFTPALIRFLNERCEPMVVMLWGGHAQKLSSKFSDRHKKIMCAHPSPLSAHTGFFGSKCFSKANSYLKSLGRGSVDWSL